MSILPCYGILAAVLGAMDYTLSVVSLLAGLGAFLFGFKVLSDNIEKLATNRLRSWFDKTGKSRLAGVGIGTAVTAIIQSSSATTVMVVGFVNAGLMSLFQATTVIMGANIGTTITAYIASMAEIPLIEFVTAFTCVGVFMNMLCKSDKVKTIGLMLAGLGLVFLGLEYMSNAMSIYKDSPEFRNFLTTVSNPFLLLIIGMIFTAIVQSSSAVTSLIIVMVGQGLVIGNGGNDVLFLVLGSNIGTCITAILSSIGANTNAKRASLIHLMFNVFGSVIFTVFLLCWPTFMQDTLVTWFPNAAGLQIALFHTFFNVVCTCMFLPMANIFVKIATCIIPGKKGAGETAGDSVLLDERFITTPSVAVSQANKAASRMAELAMQSMTIALDGFLAGDESRKAQVDELNARVADMEKRIVAYLIKISASDLSLTDERLVSSIHHATSDIIRISELADNVTKYTDHYQNDKLIFSSEFLNMTQEMFDKIKKLYTASLAAFSERDFSELKDVDAIEDEIDNYRRALVNRHIKRLNEGLCQPQSASVFINLVGNLERAADHLTYIAHSIE